MDLTPILILAFMVLIFIVFLALWLAGVFTTPTPPPVPTNTDLIQKNIDILMPPSVWSVPRLAGPCRIYNYPIVGNNFPVLTNDPAVVETLQSTVNNRCYWSNELGLVLTEHICNTASCTDASGNNYTTGQGWTYYAPCGSSCYGTGEFLCIIAVAFQSSKFGTQALIRVRNSTGPAFVAAPSLEDSNQYHIVKRYNGSSVAKPNPAGHLCNIIHYLTGDYLSIQRIETETDIFYIPFYRAGRPTKALWLLAPPTSIGAAPQSQNIVYVGDLTIPKNPTLAEFTSLREKNGLMSLAYGTNFNIEPPTTDVFMTRGNDISDPFFSTNTQIIDLSRFNQMINASVYDYPYYRWFQA